MEPGEQIGDYIIVRQIGEGGMSVVYLAEHKDLGTPAVVKRLRQQLALDDQLVKYFVQGARIMHELRHPHLAAVYDYIEHGDRYFMVEEYLSGGSLADLLDKGEPISEEEALCLVPGCPARRRLCPSERYCAPRPQAGELDAESRASGQSHGLRHRQGIRRPSTDQDRR